MSKPANLFVMICNIAFIYISLMMSSGSAEASRVRVGAPEVANEDTAYTNYMNDYLREISYYTGWEYEFVTVQGNYNDQILKLLQMLQDGQIDILGGILYNDDTSKRFDFPEFDVGSAYSILSVSATNSDFDDMNYSTFDKIHIGILKTAYENLKNMNKFFDTYDAVPVITQFETKEDLIKALRSGQIDAILNNDFWVEKNQRILARFNGRPYYFATTKGNIRILNGLNSALAKIRDINPNFSNILYRKHFRYAAAFPFYMTQKEKLYVENSRPIRIVTQPTWAPLHSINPNTGKSEGVLKDVLDYISKQSDLVFEIIPTQTYAESMDKITSGEADIFIGAMSSTGFSTQHSLSMSTEIMALQMLTVQNKSIDYTKGNQRILALPHGYSYPEPYPQENIRYYENIEQCITAVSHGAADFCYGSNLAIEYAIKNQYYENIALVSSTANNDALRMAFSKSVPVELLTITNKAILSLPKETLQSFIDKNIFLDTRKITIEALIRSNPAWFVTLIISIAALIVAIVIYNAMNKIHHNRKVALNNERYRLLSELSNEYIYEYDYAKDTFIASDKLIRLCNCPANITNFSKNECDKALGAAFAASLHGDDTISEFLLKTANRQIWVRNTCSTILNEQSVPIHRIGKLVDVTAEKQEKEGLINQAQRDSLTGIFNKGTAENMAADHLQQCPSEETSVLIIFDVDNFKFINDQFGHIFGDTVLKDIAETLRNNCYNTDIPGRVGGDEFMILFKHMQEKDIVNKIDHIGRMLRVYYPENDYTVCISMGVALASGGEPYVEVMRRADLALYKAKALGKNCYFLYTPELEQEKLLTRL